MSNEPTPSQPDELGEILSVYRDMNKQLVQALITKERMAQVLPLIQGVHKVMDDAKANCLVSTLAMAMTIENVFKFVFDGVKPEEKK
jgi:hypothetical protein